MGITSTSFGNGRRVSPGRPSGAQNSVSYELRERLKQRGDKDPAEFLSEIVSNDKEEKDLRIQASNVLMPYLYNKLAPIAPPPTLILLEEQVVLPRAQPTTLSEVRANIAYLTQLKTQGQIDRTWAESLISDQRALNDSLVDEAKLLAADASNHDHVIRIEGGLPSLPGTNIVMPTLGLAPERDPGALDPTKDSLSPLEPPVPVVPTTIPERVEAALLAWSEGGRKGNVEIDGPTWDAMANVPQDVIQALFDKYGVACPVLAGPAEQ